MIYGHDMEKSSFAEKQLKTIDLMKENSCKYNKTKL